MTTDVLEKAAKEYLAIIHEIHPVYVPTWDNADALYQAEAVEGIKAAILAYLRAVRGDTYKLVTMENSFLRHIDIIEGNHHEGMKAAIDALIKELEK